MGSSASKLPYSLELEFLTKEERGEKWKLITEKKKRRLLDKDKIEAEADGYDIIEMDPDNYKVSFRATINHDKRTLSYTELLSMFKEFQSRPETESLKEFLNSYVKSFILSHNGEEITRKDFQFTFKVLERTVLEIVYEKKASTSCLIGFSANLFYYLRYSIWLYIFFISFRSSLRSFLPLALGKDYLVKITVGTFKTIKYCYPYLSPTFKWLGRFQSIRAWATLYLAFNLPLYFTFGPHISTGYVLGRCLVSMMGFLSWNEPSLFVKSKCSYYVLRSLMEMGANLTSLSCLKQALGFTYPFFGTFQVDSILKPILYR